MQNWSNSWGRAQPSKPRNGKPLKLLLQIRPGPATRAALSSCAFRNCCLAERERIADQRSGELSSSDAC